MDDKFKLSGGDLYAARAARIAQLKEKYIQQGNNGETAQARAYEEVMGTYDVTRQGQQH